MKWIKEIYFLLSVTKESQYCENQGGESNNLIFLSNLRRVEYNRLLIQ